MGKLLIIILMILIVVFATIGISVKKRSAEIPDLITANMSEIKARSLSNEALIYSIRQLNTGNLCIGEPGVNQTFENFNVLDGTIDSIKYVMVGSGDTLIATSYVTANINGKQTQYQSTAEVLYNTTYFDNAITCSEDIDITGSSTVIGNVEENVDLDFETVFDMTIAQMRSIADNYYMNPPNNVIPVNGITYIETTGNNQTQFTNRHWNGSGILIVNGEFLMTGGTFEGIIWVESGRFIISGDGNVQGTIFINSEPGEQTEVTGNCDVFYDEDIVQQLLDTYNINSGLEIKILSWKN